MNQWSVRLPWSRGIIGALSATACPNKKMEKKMLKKFAVFIGVVAISSLAYANPTCSGRISGVSISNSGAILATVRNGAGTNLADVIFCSLSSSSSNFGAEACKGVLSLLLSASAMQKNTTLWFQSASFTSCTQSWMDLQSIGFYHFRVEG